MHKLEQFLQDCRQYGCAESTIAEYQRRLSRTDTVLRTAGKSLDTATADDFIDLIRQMSRAGLASNTVGAAARTFRTFLKRTGGTDWEKIEGPKDCRTIFDCPNEAETVKVLAAAKAPTTYGGRQRYATNHIRNAALVEVSYATGCRVSELCRLQVDDLLPPIPAGRIRFKRIKGGAEHLGYITNPALVAVAAWLKCRPQPLQKLDWIFPSPEDAARPLSHDTVADLVERCGRGAGYRGHVTPHTFRRAMVTHTLNRLESDGNGAALAHVAAMVGHTTWKTTLRYVCYTDKAVKEAHRRFPKRDINGKLYYDTQTDGTPAPSPLDLTSLGISVQ